MTQIPGRQIHLDFHTSPLIPGIGADFDPAEFVRTLKAAHVDSVTVFAKCHHGHLYYNTDRPERHPGLAPGFGLLEAQVNALHEACIRAPIYISVQCDEYAANSHPEWVARRPDSGQVKRGEDVFTAGWQILDLATGYQDYLFDQTTEVLQRFKPVDGLFFDMCWDQPSTTAPFLAAMERAGLDPESEADRRTHAHRQALAFMKRFADLVKQHSPDGSCYFNSRPLSGLPEEAQYLTQVEIEALPTGGWGYMYFPKNVRYARNFGKPYLGMTARFHKSWADFGGLKPYAALEYETSQIMAHGGQCSIGDQMHPRGTLDRGAYDLIGKAYARVVEREPWLRDAKPVTQVGLFQAKSGGGIDAELANDGATRMFTQLKYQFDVIDAGTDFSKYDLVVLPDNVAMDDALADKLSAYVRNGGRLLATGLAGLSEDARSLRLAPLAVEPLGFSPFTTTYLRLDAALGEGVPPSDHVMYDRGIRVRALAGISAHGQVVEPYFERAWNHFCSHFQTPGEKATDYPVATIAGRAAYIPFPVFSAFAEHGNVPYRLLVRNLVTQLGFDPVLRVAAPTSTEATITRQGDRTIVHLLQYCPERRTRTLDIVEDIVPLHNVNLSLKLGRRPQQAYLAPGREPLPINWAADRAEVAVPVVAGHAMVVFE